MVLSFWDFLCANIICLHERVDLFRWLWKFVVSYALYQYIIYLNHCYGKKKWKEWVILPFGILTSASVCPNSNPLLSVSFVMEFITCSDILEFSDILFFKFVRSSHSPFFSLSMPWLHFFVLFLPLWGWTDRYIICHLVFLFPYIFSVLPEIVCCIQDCNISLLLSVSSGSTTA